MAGSGQCPSCGSTFPTADGYCPTDGTKIVSTAPDARDELLGKTLDGRYEIRAHLAPVREGSIGAMYLGYQPSVAREVAVKVVHAQHAYDPAAVERFLHAGRAAAQLVGPSLANVYDVGRSPEGIVYVVSELARGSSLLEHAGRAMPARRVVGLAIQLADALAAIHRQRIAHGDLDLASLMVEEASIGDQLRVVDVGLSASLVPARPGYAAPELLAGQPPSIATDLYAVGAILYELLVGAPPFAAASLEALAGKHRHEPPPQLPPNIPIPLSAIVQRLLAKYPNERPATAGDLRAALLEVQNVVGVAIARTSSNPNIALPRTASADHGQPQLPRTASVDYPSLPRTASADYGQPQLPRTASADYGPQLPRTASGDYGQLPRTATGDLSSYPVVSRAASKQLAGDAPSAPSSRRWLVIMLVALIASGGGIAAILLVG